MKYKRVANGTLKFRVKKLNDQARDEMDCGINGMTSK
jgi:hypothetical protein